MGLLHLKADSGRHNRLFAGYVLKDLLADALRRSKRNDGEEACGVKLGFRCITLHNMLKGNPILWAFVHKVPAKMWRKNAETRHIHSANPPPNRVSSVLFAGVGSFALVFALLRLGKHTLGRPANHHNFMIAHTLSCSWDRVRIGDIWGDRGSCQGTDTAQDILPATNLARRRQISRPLDIEVGFETF